MTEFELFSSLALISEVIDRQFEFWIATTFAVVIVSYSAGDKLKLPVRACVAFLYLIASAIFFIRILDSTAQASIVASELTEAGSVIGTDAVAITTTLRRLLIILGTTIVTGLIIWPNIGRHSSEREPNQSS